MCFRDRDLEITLPLLVRTAREDRAPNPTLDELIDHLTIQARRRGMYGLLAQLEREAVQDAPRDANGAP